MANAIELLMQQMMNPQQSQAGAGLADLVNQRSAPLDQILGSFGFQGKPRRHLGMDGRPVDPTAKTGLDYLAEGSPFGDMSGPENRQEYLSRRWNALRPVPLAPVDRAQPVAPAPVAGTHDPSQQSIFDAFPPPQQQPAQGGGGFMDLIRNAASGVGGMLDNVLDLFGGGQQDNGMLFDNSVLDPQQREQAARERLGLNTPPTVEEPAGSNIFDTLMGGANQFAQQGLSGMDVNVTPEQAATMAMIPGVIPGMPMAPLVGGQDLLNNIHSILSGSMQQGPPAGKAVADKVNSAFGPPSPFDVGAMFMGPVGGALKANKGVMDLFRR